MRLGPEFFSPANRLALGLASWLSQNTTLTPRQIAKFCRLDHVIVDMIRQKRIAGYIEINPLTSHRLTAEEIRRCEADERACLERRLEDLPRPPSLTPYLRAGAIADEVIHSCYAMCLYYLEYGRNAWHSTWVRRYYREGSIAASFEELKRTAEENRKQGSVFRIEQLPAIALQSDNATLLLVSLNDDTDQKKLYDVGERMRTIRSIGSHFAAARENTLMILAAADNIRFPNISLSKSLLAWKSRPCGSDFMLAWDRVHPRINPNPHFAKLIERILHGRNVTVFKEALVSALFQSKCSSLSSHEFGCLLLENGWVRLIVNGRERGAIDLAPEYLHEVLQAAGIKIDDFC
jgi:hypothetical protein